MSFDLEAFREQIRKEPHDPLHRQIRSVLSEVRAEQEAQPLVDASQNEAAAAWHEAAGHDLQNGVKWVEPISTFDAYPAGAVVTHNGKTWQNTGTGIATGEPGVDPVWEARPEPEPVDDPAE